ncbi:unnamed protein product [Penicillium salamii]|nr:unnamed protein product [Penicillium salamii]
MILALVLGAIYSVETLKPHWAWTLVTSAYQAAYALGCHLKRSSGVERWCDASNPSGLLFWVIYYLEKTLCLRLGRCSTIPDGEITVMMPGGSPGLDYARSMVKLARLAGQVYEKLYGAQALAAFDAQGRLPVQELSQELNAISLQSQGAIRAWRGCTTAPDWCMLIDFLSASDRVLLHSMQTLIHRTDPAHGNSSTSFTEACILSARQTLACHQSCPVVLEGVQSAFLTSYLSWFIFLRPFVPFIVLFCHVVETGDRGDLQRMKQFADSMRSLMPGNSDAATRHQRLFQVFYDVAQRYVDLKSASAPAPYDQDGIQLGVGDDGGGGSNEIDNCLGAIGLYPHLALSDASTAADPSSFSAPDLDPDEFQVGAGTGPAPHLPYWFQVSQQMMEMMDNDQISF